MELILNLVWGFLAIASICLWARVERTDCAERRPQLVALLMLIVVLFPVISVSDDLWSIQNPAETDSVQRSDQLASPTHSIFPAVATICISAFAGMRLGYLRSSLPAPSQPLIHTTPPPARILSRPPPAA